MDTLTFLLAPFVASLILTGIHAYLGVHVVERGVVFVDLSLAQIAALGTTVAVLYGFDPHGRGAYWTSLAFTFLGAAVFSTIKPHHTRIPQEAIIGISYAVASAAAILAMSKSIAQTEHLKEMLVGNILTVSWSEVRTTALVYGVIGLFHYLFRKRFLLISLDPKKAEQQGLSVRLWDFLFYASVGGRHAVCRKDRRALGNRLDHGDLSFGAGCFSVAQDRLADWGHHRVHLRHRLDPHGDLSTGYKACGGLRTKKF
jgi:zinc/manganese transport system permease protein